VDAGSPTAEPSVHPIRLVVTDDLRRSRLTVFFRWLLAIPHLLWLSLWSTIAFVIVVINWFATLIKGRSPEGLHDFLAGYLRYATQIEAYLLLTANPYPAFFVGTARPYPVDLEIESPERQNRWKTLFRLVLAWPALLLAGVLFGGPISWGFRGLGLAATAAFLVWFAALVKGMAPRGLRDVAAWGIGYSAQTAAYLFLLTDRYPNTDPLAHTGAVDAADVERLPRLTNDDDLRRSRVTVLFRLPLAFPHIVWLIGWTLIALLASIANWVSALAIGRSPRALARFLAAYVRYTVHVWSFLFLIGNPFPGFLGRSGSYPVDVHIDPFERQNRWKTLFRLLLWIPAALVAGAAGVVLYAAGFLGWFVSLVLGRMPSGLQRAGAYAIGYTAQESAYWFVLTDRYPHASPAAVFTGPEPESESLDSETPGAFV
jgi:Domain of unknown function (DUF4389)